MTREEAINAITQFIENYACGSDLIGLNTAIETLKKERPHGEWIHRRIIGENRSFDMVVCSNCQTEFSYDAETGVFMDNYRTCPNCGADMREIRKEQNLPFRLDCPCDDCKKMCIKCVYSCKKFREWKER